MAIIPVAVIGAPGVGKTTCIEEIVSFYSLDKNDAGQGIFTLNEQSYRATDTDDDFGEDRATQLQVIHSHNIFIMVYAIDDENSFKEMDRLKSIIEDTKGAPTKFIVIGNKVDLRQNMNDSVVADCIVSIEWGIHYVEMSATEGTNIGRFEEMFLENFKSTLTCRRKPSQIKLQRQTAKRRNTIQIPCYGDFQIASLSSRRSSIRRSSLTKFLQRCSTRLMAVVN